MNRKVILAALAVAMSITSVQATNITGVTGQGNVYNVNPQNINGQVGYSLLDNFQVSQGDQANLNCDNINTFVNMVRNQVVVDGILSTVKNGKYGTGNAVFITPKGFAVGASGVLNVGSLHVATPTNEKFESLAGKFGTLEGYQEINNFSELKANGNADIIINGKVFARDGIDLRGANVSVAGNLVNGIKGNQKIDSAEQANSLFNSLVNTDGMPKSADLFENNGTSVYVVSHNNGGITTTQNSTITNGANGAVYIYNNGGTQGINAAGNVGAANKITYYNTNGDLVINSGAKVGAKKIEVANHGAGLTVNSGTTLTADSVNIQNAGTGILRTAGNIYGNGEVFIKNDTGSEMQVAGTIENKSGMTALNNHKGNMFIDGKINNTGTLGIMNREGNGQLNITENAVITNNGGLRVYNAASGGMNFKGSTTNTGDIFISNENGKMQFLEGKVSNTGGKFQVIGYGNSNGIYQDAKSTISNSGDLLAIGNSSTKLTKDQYGVVLNGNVTNDKTTAINNHSGSLAVNGTIENNNGVLGIMNREGDGALVIGENAKVNNNSYTLIENNGKGGMSVQGSVNNSGQYAIVRNNEGTMAFYEKSNVTSNGGLYVIGDKNSTGIVQKDGSVIKSTSGELAIQNKGAGVKSGSYGMQLAGTIVNEDGSIDINNHSGSMDVSGKVTLNKENSNGNKNHLVMMNREGSENFTSSANVTLNDGDQAYIMNAGSGNMEIAGTINNNNTKVNVVSYKGAATLSGNYNGNVNNSTDGLYAISGSQATSLNTRESFNANGTGTVVLENLSGKDGLNHQGKVDMNGNAGRVLVVNQAGDMNLKGSLKTTGTPVQIVNNGLAQGLYIREGAQISSGTEGQLFSLGAKKMVQDSKATVNNIKKYEQQ